MTETARYTCPLCGRPGAPDGREPASVAGQVFESVVCDAPPRDLSEHPFPVRWLEAECRTSEEVEDFRDRFVFVRGPLPEGTAIAEAFGNVDPISAWIEELPGEDAAIRLLIRL